MTNADKERFEGSESEARTQLPPPDSNIGCEKQPNGCGGRNPTGIARSLVHSSLHADHGSSWIRSSHCWLPSKALLLSSLIRVSASMECLPTQLDTPHISSLQLTPRVHRYLPYARADQGWIPISLDRACGHLPASRLTPPASDTRHSEEAVCGADRSPRYSPSPWGGMHARRAAVR